jgi:hypothetical protein
MELMGIMRKDAEHFKRNWIRPGLFNKYQLG